MRNAYLEGSADDITQGRLTLDDVDPAGLDVALKRWPEVVQRLGVSK